MSVRGLGGDHDCERLCGVLERQYIERWFEIGWQVLNDIGGCGLEYRRHRTLYGARMAARQARVDYSPGGRLYAGGES